MRLSGMDLAALFTLSIAPATECRQVVALVFYFVTRNFIPSRIGINGYTVALLKMQREFLPISHSTIHKNFLNVGSDFLRLLIRSQNL